MTLRSPWYPPGAALGLLVAAGCSLPPLPQPQSGTGDLPATTLGGAAAPEARLAAGEDATSPDGMPLTIRVQATKDGFSPSDISIPVGQPVRLVLVNRDSAEHHLHVLGLRAADALWLARGPADGGSGPSVRWVSQHPCNHYCASGICYTKNTVHTYAAPGDADEVLFTAVERGEFTADDPLHPAMHATVRVF